MGGCSYRCGRVWASQLESTSLCKACQSFADEQSQELHSYAEATNKCPAKKVYQQKELLLCCAPGLGKYLRVTWLLLTCWFGKVTTMRDFRNSQATSWIKDVDLLAWLMLQALLVSEIFIILGHAAHTGQQEPQKITVLTLELNKRLGRWKLYGRHSIDDFWQPKSTCPKS